MNKYDYDYIVIGSGFGWKCICYETFTEGIYKVAVIESGKRWKSEIFRRQVFLLLNMFGFQRFLLWDTAY